MRSRRPCTPKVVTAQCLAGDSFRDFGARLAWQGIVGVDLLRKLRHEYRPYEQDPGETDRVYQAALQRLMEAIRSGGGRQAVRAMAWAGQRFAAVELDRSQRRPPAQDLDR